MRDLEEELLEKYFDDLELRNNFVWNGQIKKPIVKRWLSNFLDLTEKEMALELLIQFTYFRQEETNSLLKSAFNQLCHKILFDLEKTSESTANVKEFVEKHFNFFAMWHSRPTKSGTHLLDPFKTVNKLSEEAFPDDPMHSVKDGKDFVFIDDMIGTGTEAVDYWKDKLSQIANQLPYRKFYYLALFGLQDGIKKVRDETCFNVIVVTELDKSQQIFSDESGYFVDSVKKTQSKEMCEKHGKRIYQEGPLGFGGAQLLLGFYHSIPDNTLPIIWSDRSGWFPIFKKFGS